MRVTHWMEAGIGNTRLCQHFSCSVELRSRVALSRPIELVARDRCLRLEMGRTTTGNLSRKVHRVCAEEGVGILEFRRVCATTHVHMRRVFRNGLVWVLTLGRLLDGSWMHDEEGSDWPNAVHGCSAVHPSAPRAGYECSSGGDERGWCSFSGLRRKELELLPVLAPRKCGKKPEVWQGGSSCRSAFLIALFRMSQIHTALGSNCLHVLNIIPFLLTTFFFTSCPEQPCAYIPGPGLLCCS